MAEKPAGAPSPSVRPSSRAAPGARLRDRSPRESVRHRCRHRCSPGERYRPEMGETVLIRSPGERYALDPAPAARLTLSRWAYETRRGGNGPNPGRADGIRRVVGVECSPGERLTPTVERGAERPGAPDSAAPTASRRGRPRRAASALRRVGCGRLRRWLRRGLGRRGVGSAVGAGVGSSVGCGVGSSVGGGVGRHLGGRRGRDSDGGGHERRPARRRRVDGRGGSTEASGSTRRTGRATGPLGLSARSRGRRRAAPTSGRTG